MRNMLTQLKCTRARNCQSYIFHMAFKSQLFFYVWRVNTVYFRVHPRRPATSGRKTGAIGERMKGGRGVASRGEGGEARLDCTSTRGTEIRC
ncbi:hypothetical protein PUN28_006216 [Cardiocondyla obscurior]|uniref:Uncharacterized protein n=1 Tax=Cardiocondyla obscurior TaxID=286306 RepID=A0AAW2G7K4_9HYME